MATPQLIDAFLSSYPDEVQESARAARRLLKDMLPGIAETIDESAELLSYSYGTGYKGLLFTLIMSRTGVKLGIIRGSELPDPTHLMAGAGKVHRHVQLRSAGDLEKPGLEQLLKAAVSAWRSRNDAEAK